METSGTMEVLVRFEDLSAETFRGANQSEIVESISGRNIRAASVRLLTANQHLGFGYAEICDASASEGVLECALRRAQRNRADRLAPRESGR
jgi:hypothetical protein